MLPKCPTGIRGLDELTGGGLPKGRSTLVCGDAGAGKTLFGLEFLVNGARLYDEPGVFLGFDESQEELAANCESLGFQLQELIADGKIVIHHVAVERNEIEETGGYDLAGLFIRLGHAIDSIKAKRVALDTIDALIPGFENELILRAEIRRLFRWFKAKGVTAVVTSESGMETLTRYGLQEYHADCILLLDRRSTGPMVTRRLRIVKYRGAAHALDEHSFLIDETGFFVVPTAVNVPDREVSTERVSTGIADLDVMLEGEGYFRGSTIVISGASGTGKTGFAAHFADALCRNGETALFCSLAESEGQLIRDVRSMGIDLEPWVKQGRLRFSVSRAVGAWFELHLAAYYRLVEEYKPTAVIFDPISGLAAMGSSVHVAAMLTGLMDFLKANRITAVFTDLSPGYFSVEPASAALTPLMDTWISLHFLESGDELVRGVHVVKSKGMAHSSAMRTFRFTDKGIQFFEM